MRTAHLGISPNLEPPLTKVTFAPETPDRRRVVHPYFLLLGIVPDSLTDMSVAMSAEKETRENSCSVRVPHGTSRPSRLAGRVVVEMIANAYHQML